jgi:hypothetical protein
LSDLPDRLSAHAFSASNETRISAEVEMNAPAAHWDILKQDLRYTARTLTRARGFSLTVILVTALGVGANTAAFSVADYVLLRPLPFADPDTLVRLCEGPRQGGGWGCMNQVSPANYRDFKSMSTSFAAMGAFAGDAVNLVGGGEPRRLAIARLTPEVLPLLGVNPASGRVFSADGIDDVNAVVLSHGLWQSQFAADAGILRRKVTLNGAPYTVIGVSGGSGQPRQQLHRRRGPPAARDNVRPGARGAVRDRRSSCPRIPGDQ